jgi:hypothetical protein
MKVDISNEEPLEDLTPVPSGNYPVLAVQTEDRDTFRGQKYGVIKWQITSGEHAGRVIYDQFYLNCDSENGRRYAVRKLVSAATACGFKGDKKNFDTLLLKDHKCIIKVTLDESERKDLDGNPYPPKNKVQNYLPLNSQTRSPGPQAARIAPPVSVAPKQPAKAAVAKVTDADLPGDDSEPWQ